MASCSLCTSFLVLQVWCHLRQAGLGMRYRSSVLALGSHLVQGLMTRIFQERDGLSCSCGECGTLQAGEGDM